MERTLTRRKGVIPMIRGIHLHGLLLPHFVNEDCDVDYPSPQKPLVNLGAVGCLREACLRAMVACGVYGEKQRRRNPVLKPVS